MMKENFLAELKIYDDRIIEAVQDYYLIERMADWYEANQETISKYSSTFVPISSALKTKLFVTYTALFDKRSQYGLKEMFEKYETADWYQANDIGEIQKAIIALFDNNISSSKAQNHEMNKPTDIVKKWRDKVFVHMDEESVVKSAFDQLNETSQIIIDDIMDNLRTLHDNINCIKKRLGEKPRLIFSFRHQSIDNLFMKLCHTDNMPKLGFNIDCFLEQF